MNYLSSYIAIASEIVILLEISFLAQVFSCEFSKKFNNTFFAEQLRTTASENVIFKYQKFISDSVKHLWWSFLQK